MTQYEARLELKSKLQQELLSFVDLEEVAQGWVDGGIMSDEFDSKDEYFTSLRDEWIDELNDRLTFTLEVIGYAKGLEIASALGYWNWENNDLGIEVQNAEQLGFVASYDYVQHEGLVYDVVDAYLKDEFDFELNK